MKSPVKRWEAITIISIMAIVIVDAIVFPILTRNVMPLLGRANWLEIIFRIIIDLSFVICLIYHKKPIAQLLIVFLVIPNISTLMPVLFRYNSFFMSVALFRWFKFRNNAFSPIRSHLHNHADHTYPHKRINCSSTKDVFPDQFRDQFFRHPERR